MDYTISTPALLFSAITLLLLAYTNRFLALASLIRNLQAKYQQEKRSNFLEQIYNLRRRIYFIRNMQMMAVASIFLCVLSMFLIFAHEIMLSKVFFTVSMLLLMGSLLYSLAEIRISVKALDLHLQDVEVENQKS